MPRSRVPGLCCAVALLLVTASSVARAQQAPPPAPVPPPAADQTPRWHTNAENVRRIVPGEKHVAFATSGGVRVWDRAADSWRLVTMNEGLPTNNVYDVAFDPEEPTTLWALCGDWVKLETDPMPRLHLATIDLARGAVTRLGEASGIAPKTARSYPYWLDYRLGVSKDMAAVSAGNRVVLAFDRATGQWLDRVPVDVPLARASHLPAVSATVTDYVVNADYAAVLLRTGVYLYDRKTGEWSPRPFAAAERITPRPGSLRFAGASGSVTFEGTRILLPPPDPAGRPRSVVARVQRGRFRANPVTTGVVLEQEERRPMTARNAPGGVPGAVVPGPPAPPRPRPQVTFCTDLVGDGKYLWVASYNQPYQRRTGGIARLDMETGQWHHPQAPGGLAANVGRLTRFRSGRIAYSNSTYSLYAAAKQAFAEVTDWATLRDDFLADQAGFMRRPLPDPRLAPEERGISITLIGTLDEHTSLAYGPEEPYRFLADGQPNRGGVPTFVTFLYDHRTQELTPITYRVPDMKGFNPRFVRKFGDTVFLLGETARPVPPAAAGQLRASRPLPEPPLLTVWQWNPKDGTARMADRVTWAEAQRERDARNRRLREWEERRRRGSREPRIFEPTPATNFTEAAGHLWVMWEHHLYRYDPRSDSWLPQGRADSLHPEGTGAGGALWAIVHARKGDPGVARYWSAAGGGWQRVTVDDVTASMLAACAPDGDTVWFGGVGVVSVPRRMLRFTPEDAIP